MLKNGKSRPQWAPNQKIVVFWYKNRKTDLKNSQNSKPKIPMPPSVKVVLSNPRPLAPFWTCKPLISPPAFSLTQSTNRRQLMFSWFEHTKHFTYELWIWLWIWSQQVSCSLLAEHSTRILGRDRVPFLKRDSDFCLSSFLDYVKSVPHISLHFCSSHGSQVFLIQHCIKITTIII